MCDHLPDYRIEQETWTHIHGLRLGYPTEKMTLIICRQCGKTVKRKFKAKFPAEQDNHIQESVN